MKTRVACAVLLALSACGAADRPLSSSGTTAETVTVDGDLLIRTISDATLEVIVHRSHAGKTAPGAIRVHRATRDSIRSSPHLHFAGARAWQALASMPELPAEARYIAARNGVDELGDRYRVRKIIDDTSSMLLLAREEAKEPTMLDKAAERVRHVLASRLRLYARAYRGDVE